MSVKAEPRERKSLRMIFLVLTNGKKKQLIDVSGESNSREKGKKKTREHNSRFTMSSLHQYSPLKSTFCQQAHLFRRRKSRKELLLSLS